jgi:hypothetical protein
MKLKLVLLCAGLLALGAVGGYAAIPGADGTITACVNANGDVKVIDAEAGEVCAKNKKTLTWNQQGPAGPQGSSGLLETHVATTTGPLGSGNVRAAFVNCEPGELVLGGGAKAFTTYQGNEFNPIHVAITQSYPTAGGTVQGWGVYANETTTDYAGDWQLRAYAICATPAP